MNSGQVEGLFKGASIIKIENDEGRSNISIPTLLNSARTDITLTSFPPIISTVGPFTVTVTKTSGGSGSYARGHIVLPLGLHFAVSGPLGNSDLSTTLTTDPPGSPVTPEPLGAVTLVGSGILQGGVVGGRKCDLTVTGTISANMT